MVSYRGINRDEMNLVHLDRDEKGRFVKGHKVCVGRKYHRETLQKMSEARKEWHKYNLHPKPMLGKKHSKETKEKWSRDRKKNPINYWLGKKLSEEHKRKIGGGSKGRKHTDKTKKKMSLNMKKRWKDEKSARKLRKASFKGLTKPEKQLNKLLQEYFPNEFKYAGNGEVVFGGKNPDFINCNGKKLIIEMFGRIYHDPKLKPKSMRKVKWHEQEIGTKMHYSQYGFKTLVIWDDELKNEREVTKKIENFMEK